MLKCDDRFARQNRGGPPPEFPLASPSSSIVHHLSGPIGRAPTGTVRNRPPSVDDAPPALKWVVLVSVASLSLSLSAFDLPRTRAHARLLGPCFKTGPMRPEIVPRVSLFTSRERSAAHPRRVGASGTSVDEGDSLTSFVGWRATTEGETDGATRRSASESTSTHAGPRHPFNGRAPAAWALIRTVSRTVELSFQSSFHLSLAVLVRYRSRARIEPWMESTTRLWAAIPNNPTLGRRSSGGAPSGTSRTGFSPSPTLPSKKTRRATAPPRSLPSVYNSDTRCRIPTVGRFPLHSPLLRESWLVSRPPPSDMLKFGG